LAFTFYRQQGLCVTFANCPQVSAALCSGCVSSNAECEPYYACGFQGECYGASFVGRRDVNSVEECRDACLDNDFCYWYEFNSADFACIMTEDCPRTNDNCETCVVNERECDLSQQGSTTSQP